MAGQVYITHCSGKKDDSLKSTGRKVTPDKLYTSERIKGFMGTCKRQGVSWAIFSDKYGIWFPWESRGWYEKPPSKVTPAEFKLLLANFDRRLSSFQEIMFYRHPARFGRLYKRLIAKSKLRKNIRLFSHKKQVR
jgi:hypothetical protein